MLNQCSQQLTSELQFPTGRVSGQVDVGVEFCRLAADENQTELCPVVQSQVSQRGAREPRAVADDNIQLQCKGHALSILPDP